MSRTVLVHLHLFKNAGTSVDAMLGEHLGARWRSFDHPEPWATVTAGELADAIYRDPALAAISSHQIRPPLPRLDGVELVPIVFLRHPLDRIRSVYAFDRARGPVTPAAEVAAAHDLAGYVDEMIDRGHDQVCNFAARTLSAERDPDTGERHPVTDEAHGASAASFLAGLHTVGVVERFDDSVARMLPNLRRVAPSIAPPDRRHNVTAAAPADNAASDAGHDSLEGRLRLLRDTLGHDRYQRLLAANDVDLRLHADALRALDGGHRVDDTPGGRR